MTAEAVLEREDLAAVAAKLRRLVRPAIELRATPAEDAAIKVGASKIGGAPDLPAGTPWPMAKLPVPKKHGEIAEGFFERTRKLPDDGTIALPFIAQLRLADLAKQDAEERLPRTGLLSFFYNTVAYYEAVAKGGSVVSGGKRYRLFAWRHPANWRVLYTEGRPKLARLAAPADVPVLAPRKLDRPRATTTLPSYETSWFAEPGARGTAQRIALDEEQRAAYIEGLYDERANRATHMVLGHADEMQPYALESIYASAHGEPLPVPAAHASRLLLQISSDRDNRFGRDGRLYFFIRDEDLRARAFDRVWAGEQ